VRPRGVYRDGDGGGPPGGPLLHGGPGGDGVALAVRAVVRSSFHEPLFETEPIYRETVHAIVGWLTAPAPLTRANWQRPCCADSGGGGSGGKAHVVVVQTTGAGDWAHSSSPPSSSSYGGGAEKRGEAEKGATVAGLEARGSAYTKQGARTTVSLLLLGIAATAVAATVIIGIGRSRRRA
jgi:hypothetical protein